MKIGVAADKMGIAEHFGHCEQFLVYDTDGKSIIKREIVPNPGHKPGFLPVFLHEQGVNVIISGGMGQGAVTLFQENGIEVVTGAQGEAESAVKQYIEGTLKFSGAVCSEHSHHDD